MQAEVVVERERGCGYRKPGKDGVGVYLVGPKTGAPCGRLPFPLSACPACGGGVHASRGWTWIEPKKLFGVPKRPCEVGWSLALVQEERELVCRMCPMGLGIPEGRHGLIWIGERFYKKPQDFLDESNRMGVSRKIKTVPKGFELGVTFVYLAHRFAVPTGEVDDAGNPKMGPGVFSTFKPTGIDLVVADANQMPEKAERLSKQYGARVIQVVHGDGVAEQLELPGTGASSQRPTSTAEPNEDDNART